MYQLYYKDTVCALGMPLCTYYLQVLLLQQCIFVTLHANPGKDPRVMSQQPIPQLSTHAYTYFPSAPERKQAICSNKYDLHSIPVETIILLVILTQVHMHTSVGVAQPPHFSVGLTLCFKKMEVVCVFLLAQGRGLIMQQSYTVFPGGGTVFMQE